ncbi:hypothetical protein [Streptomyces sp. CB03238]|uniref:hypothetical protein n=1 Tax=Streptomyces sp. CB03238 TaxID=1907777 RepID=UPI0015C43A8A|nr:hypothetical protein [Streptomyces sp. CB03238]
MADERDEWLDQDAAERLLRGEPVGPVDDHAWEQARRVARALDAMRAAADPARGELPGEEAALAAFREARAEKAAGARAAVTPLSGVPGHSDVPELGTVRDRLGPRRRMRWARPVRWGLAASVAGLAVGGVAVAAGTGVLPVLGGDSEPLPAASVSAAPAPGTSASGDPTGGSGSATPGTPSEPGSVPPSGSATPGAGTDRVPGRPDHGRTGGVGGDDGSGGGPGSATGDGEGAGPGSGPGDNWFAQTVQDCRDYRDGRLDPERKKLLEEDARGAANLKRFCDKVLDGDAQHQNGSSGGSGGGNGTGGTGTGSGGSGSGGGAGGGEDEGRDGGEEGGDSDAARPTVSWSPLAPALSVRQTGLVF